MVITDTLASMDDNAYFTAVAARRLKSARQQADLPLREAARRAGTSHATLHAYESGRKTPSVATYLRILEACGYAVDFEFSPRIRWANGILRGDELQQVLRLAGEFPARVSRYMDYPKFGCGSDGSC